MLKKSKEKVIKNFINDINNEGLGLRLHGYDMDKRIQESVFAEDEDEKDYELYL